MKRILTLLIFTTQLLLQYSCTKSPQPASAENGMVVSTSSYASKVGVEILKKGGNAIDAAVAVGFALAVTYPSAGNLGGGGFMVIHLADGKNIAIDYREKAPLSAHRDMYLNDAGDFVRISNIYSLHYLTQEHGGRCACVFTHSLGYLTWPCF